jgi:hypothetical protein
MSFSRPTCFLTIKKGPYPVGSIEYVFSFSLLAVHSTGEGEMTEAENGRNRAEDAMSAEKNPATLKRTMSAGTIPPYTRHGSSLASLSTMDVFNKVPKEKLDDNR